MEVQKVELVIICQSPNFEVLVYEFPNTPYFSKMWFMLTWILHFSYSQLGLSHCEMDFGLLIKN